MTVRFEGTLTTEHVEVFRDLSARPRKGRLVTLPVLIAFAFIIGLISYFYAVVGAVSWVLVALLLINVWRCRRQTGVRMFGDINAAIPTSGFLDEAGFTYHIRNSFYQWSDFAGYAYTGDQVILFTKEHLGYLLPKHHFLDDADWQQSLDLIAQNLELAYGDQKIEVR